MKKHFLLLAMALMSSVVSFAQENLARPGADASRTVKATATVIYGGDKRPLKGDGTPETTEKYSEINAPGIIDGNIGGGTDIGSGYFPNGYNEESDIDNDVVSFEIDLGNNVDFDFIQIYWEAAYSKKFKIEYKKSTDENYSLLTTEDGFDYAKGNKWEYKSNSVLNAQYIKITNIRRGSVYGVHMYEFLVFKQETPKFTSIDLAADVTTAKVGSGVKLTVAGKDQYNNDIATGELTYEVTPADNGTVADGVFTPAKAGQTTIVAKAGDVASKPVTITSYEGEKINIFSNYKSMVTPLGEETTTGNMVKAFDDDMGSIWDLHANTNDDETARTYETGFVIDFGAIYDITAVSLSFEGAQSQDYTIAFAGQDGVYTIAETYSGPTGTLAHNEYYVEKRENVRYVKFLSTKAGTQYGVKLYDFTVYGDNKREIKTVDAEVKEIGYATFSNSDAPVLFGDNVKVFTAKVSDGNTTVTLTEVADKKVPAGAGVIIKAENGTYKATVLSEDVKFEEGSNDLKVADSEITADGNSNYFVLSKVGEDAVGFYKLADQAKIPAGKAYLEINNASKTAMKMVIGGGNGGGTTGISNINAAENNNGAAYNLNGIRVNDSYKGIVIINGKKVIRK